MFALSSALPVGFSLSQGASVHTTSRTQLQMASTYTIAPSILSTLMLWITTTCPPPPLQLGPVSIRLVSPGFQTHLSPLRPRLDVNQGSLLASSDLVSLPIQLFPLPLLLSSRCPPVQNLLFSCSPVSLRTVRSSWCVRRDASRDWFSTRRPLSIASNT